MIFDKVKFIGKIIKNLDRRIKIKCFDIVFDKVVIVFDKDIFNKIKCFDIVFDKVVMFFNKDI